MRFGADSRFSHGRPTDARATNHRMSPIRAAAPCQERASLSFRSERWTIPLEEARVNVYPPG